MSVRALHVFVYAALASIFFFSAPYAHAQFALPGIGDAVSLTLSPQYPAPGASVRIEAGSSAYDLSESSLTWRVNGKVFAQGVGITSADVVAGGLGSSVAISIEATAPDGAELFAEVAVAPTEVDLLFDADSYVPPFYTGRALPSAGSTLRLEAIPHFVAENGKEIPSSDITFTWKRNDQVLGSVSGRGRSTARIPAPALFGTDTISVEAISLDKSLAGSATVRIPSAEPVLALYQDHPLFGLMTHRALGPQSLIPDSEMTFAAIPYFAPVANLYDRSLQWSWRVNNTPIASDQKRPNEITIGAQNSNGIGLLALELSHLTNVFFQASGSWGVTLSSGGASGGLFGGSE